MSKLSDRNEEDIKRVYYMTAACRSCKHLRFLHRPETNSCVDTSLDDKDFTYESRCICKEFLPSDNLEYMEYLYKKKKEKKKKKNK